MHARPKPLPHRATSRCCVAFDAGTNAQTCLITRARWGKNSDCERSAHVQGPPLSENWNFPCLHGSSDWERSTLEGGPAPLSQLN